MDARVFVGTSRGLVLAGSGPITGGRRVDAVAHDSNSLWVLLDGADVMRGPLDGGNAPDLADTAPHAEGTLRCLLPTGETAWAGAADAALFRLGGHVWERVAGFDEAPGRDGWYTPWGGPPNVRSIATDPAGVVYVNVHVGGIPRSEDQGATWEPTIDVDADVHQVVADPEVEGRVYAATAYGLATTRDSGRTWDFTTDGLHAGYCRAVAVDDGMLYLSAARGSRGADAAVYRRPVESDGPLERCRAGLPEWFTTNVDTFCLEASGGLVVVGDAAGTVYGSVDQGATWEQLAAGLGDVRCLTVA